jgi:RecA-family ATPase
MRTAEAIERKTEKAKRALDNALQEAAQKEQEEREQQERSRKLEAEKRKRQQERDEAVAKIQPKVAAINAAELLATHFPDVRWAIEGFLPTGCSILCGGPKVGKSILALHLALSVAIGGTALGHIDVEQGDVLYMALEDTRRRLQSRILDSGISDNADLSPLTLVTEIPRQHEGGVLWLDDWLSKNKETRFVIIDTLQKFRKPHTSNGDRYGSDYDAVSAIKTVADHHDVSVLLIHHTKKAKDADDWLNEVSGTQGLAGAADTLLFLQRGRCQNSGVLRLTGRDVEETEFAMTLDGMGWRLEGTVEEFSMSGEKQAIILQLREGGMQSPKDVASALCLKLNTIQQRMRRMCSEGLISGYGGKYWME